MPLPDGHEHFDDEDSGAALGADGGGSGVGFVHHAGAFRLGRAVRVGSVRVSGDSSGSGAANALTAHGRQHLSKFQHTI